MAPQKKAKPGPCNPACSKTIKFMTGQAVPASVGINIGSYQKIDGYRFINIFVQFTQMAVNEAPVDLGVIFAFDTAGTLGARSYVNFEEGLPARQATNFIDISGAATWGGTPFNLSSYVARFPIMGPYAQVFVYNQAPIARTVDVWAYLVS